MKIEGKIRIEIWIGKEDSTRKIRKDCIGVRLDRNQERDRIERENRERDGSISNVDASSRQR